jgi:hypothetical protein
VPRALLALTIVLAACSGCGSGGDDRLSKDEYAKRADAVCRHYNAATRGFGAPQTMPALARVTARSLPFLDTAIRDLRALKPPGEEDATARAWVRQLVLLRGELVHMRDRARANDARGVRAVVPAATRRNERFGQLAARLGMSVCSRP